MGQGDYLDAESMDRDMAIMFDNARRYNPEGSPVYIKVKGRPRRWSSRRLKGARLRGDNIEG